MSDDSDLIKLYSGRILALAAEIPLTTRLDNPDATVMKRAPLCGSNVTVDVKVSDGRITGFGQDVKACALGQASASVMAAQVIGCDEHQIATALEQLRQMLKENGPVPAAPFEGFEVLLPAIEYKNRHASIMLALSATLAAVQQAKKNAAT